MSSGFYSFIELLTYLCIITQTFINVAALLGFVGKTEKSSNNVNNAVDKGMKVIEQLMGQLQDDSVPQVRRVKRN